MKFWTDIFVKVVQRQKGSKSALDAPHPFSLKKVEVRAAAENKASEGRDHTGS